MSRIGGEGGGGGGGGVAVTIDRCISFFTSPQNGLNLPTLLADARGINNMKSHVSLHYSTRQSLLLNFPNKVSLCPEPKIKSLPKSIKLRLLVICEVAWS